MNTINSLSDANALIAKGDVAHALSVINIIDATTKELLLSMNSRQRTDRFYAFFLKLLDRLFGQEATTTGEPAATMVGGLDTWRKGQSGGWLRELADQRGLRTSRAQEVRDQFAAPFYRSISNTASDYLKYLAPTSVVFDILFKIQGGYEMKLALLPRKTQMYIGNHPVFYCLHTANSFKISHLLSKGPIYSQIQVKNIYFAHDMNDLKIMSPN